MRETVPAVGKDNGAGIQTIEATGGRGERRERREKEATAAERRRR